VTRARTRTRAATDIRIDAEAPGADRHASVVLPSAAAIGRLRPTSGSDVEITGGFWGERLETNRTRTLGHGYAQLQAAGTLDNLRLAAGAKGTYQAFTDSYGSAFPFVDSDVYKWLEAVGWELGRADDAGLAADADEAIALVAAAQRPDGYLNSYVQVVTGGEPYRDLAWGHELYCVGHLVQAAIAWHRAIGDDRLLGIAVRAVDALEREFGASGRDGIDGHPEIEMALVELWRTTGERRYLDLAARLVAQRGHGLLGAGRFGAAYWQDHLPVREAPSVAGHAVRQMYLDCGAVDVAVESGDTELLDAVIQRWEDMVETRSYLTGGLGSRHRDEAFGDPFELPPDRAYAETCASIASVMLAWRLLLATGAPRFADVLERTVYNGVLAGLSLDGTRFYYVNPLQRRTLRSHDGHGDGGRAPWYPCACCPPNLMRLLSSWEQYVATTDRDGIQIHQFAKSDINVDLPAGRVRLAVDTEYPWDGRVTVSVVEAPDEPWTVRLRVPAWCRSATLDIGDGPTAIDPAAGSISARRAWRPGDKVTLTLDMPGRITMADPRVDATRGCAALERGPLVYCIETVDLPSGVDVEQVTIDRGTQPVTVPRPDIADSVVALRVRLQATPANHPDDGDRPDIEADAVPYHTWANRDVQAMRVWIPTSASSGTNAPLDRS
jgi:uncharacterized protein